MWIEASELIAIIRKTDNELKIYHPEDIQRIFGWDNKNRVYELMNTSGFPSFRVNKELLVEKKSFEKWVNQYEGKVVRTNRA